MSSNTHRSRWIFYNDPNLEATIIKKRFFFVIWMVNVGTKKNDRLKDMYHVLLYMRWHHRTQQIIKYHAYHERRVQSHRR